jgi:hypothetical protein
MTMIDSEPEIDQAKLAAVSAPALVLQGDRDEVTFEQGAAVAAALGDGRLAVVPCAEQVAPLAEDFPRQCPGDEHLRNSRACNEDLVVHVSRTD